jgi:hypothetical protein
MTVVLPKLVQVASPNFSDRHGERIRLVVVHDTEGSYEGAVAWFAQKASQVSAHFVMREDGGEVTQMVPLAAKAWHACNFNPFSVGIEGAGTAAKGFSPAWWKGMAKIVAWTLHAYDLPPRWAEGGQGDGFCSHYDLGTAGGGHHDPVAVGSPVWDNFKTLVANAYSNFSAGPLPVWALRSEPAPKMLSPAPAVAPEPSHGGADRKGSEVALKSKWEVIAFQRSRGLTPDGIIGPKTLAEIRKVNT